MFNPPDAWDSKRLGDCGILAVCKQDGVYFSYWKPTLIDRVKIFFGSTIRLAIVGSQPPVTLDTKKI